MKRSLIKRIRDRVEASRGIEALSLPVFNLLAGPWGPASSSCSPIKLVGGLSQGLCQAQDSGAIAIKI